MSLLRAVYLALATWGGAEGVVALRSGVAAGGAGADLLAPGGLTVAILALFIWSLAEVYVRKNWIALVALPATWWLGLGCGLPLYLFLRTAPPR